MGICLGTALIRDQIATSSRGPIFENGLIQNRVPAGSLVGAQFHYKHCDCEQTLQCINTFKQLLTNSSEIDLPVMWLYGNYMTVPV